MKQCPYCGSKVILQDSIIIYRKQSYGLVYTCEKYPRCDAYVSCHKGTKKPLGTLANAELRSIRNLGHATFDRIWKEKILTRTQAYAWLAKRLGLKVEQTHFAMFDKETALKAIDIANQYYNNVMKSREEDKYMHRYQPPPRTEPEPTTEPEPKKPNTPGKQLELF